MSFLSFFYGEGGGGTRRCCIGSATINCIFKESSLKCYRKYYLKDQTCSIQKNKEERNPVVDLQIILRPGFARSSVVDRKETNKACFNLKIKLGWPEHSTNEKWRYKSFIESTNPITARQAFYSVLRKSAGGREN